MWTLMHTMAMLTNVNMRVMLTFINIDLL